MAATGRREPPRERSRRAGRCGLCAWTIARPTVRRGRGAAAPARRARHGRRRPPAPARPSPAVTVARGLGGPPEATAARHGDPVSAPAAALATGDPRARARLRRHPRRRAGARHRGRAAGRARRRRAGRRDRCGGARRRASPATRPCAGSPPPPRTRFHARGLHATSACGVFAAALAAARLMRPRPTRRPSTRSASPAARPAGCWSSSPPARRPSSCTRASPPTPGSSPPGSPRPGRPARRRCSRARTGCLRRAGRRARADPSRCCRRPRAALGDARGSRIKPYPACQLMHATLDAGRARCRGRSTRRRSPSVVARRAPRQRRRSCARPDKAAPRTAYDAKFSLPWSVAACCSTDGCGRRSTPTTVTAGPTSPRWPPAVAIGSLAGVPASPPTRPAGSTVSSPTTAGR